MENSYDKFYEEIINGTYDPEVEMAKERRNRNMFYLVRELNESPDMLKNIKNLMDYRDLRKKQSWLSNFYFRTTQMCDGELKLQSLRHEVSKLDRDRRNYHNRALASFYSLVNDMKAKGIPPIYTGRLMSPYDDKVKRYGDPNIRQEMTDAFLGILYDISETTIEDLKIENGEYSEGVQTFRSIARDLQRQDSSYGVKKPLTKDECKDDIEFYNK